MTLWDFIDKNPFFSIVLILIVGSCLAAIARAFRGVGDD